MRRRGDVQDQPEKATPFAELARWIRARALTLLSPTARGVLLALEAHTNSEGEAWPGAEVIAEETAQGTTRHKRQTIYKAFKQIERVGIYERTGRFRQPGYNMPGPIIFRLRPLDSQAANRLKRLLDVPVAGTSKRGDQKRFVKPVVPARVTPDVPAAVPPVVPPPVNPDVPATGTQKGFKEQREKERGQGKGSMRGKQYGQAQAPAPPLSKASELSPGLSEQNDKSTIKRDEQRQSLLGHFMRLGEAKQSLSWYVEYFTKQGYDADDVEWAWYKARRDMESFPPAKETSRADEVGE